MNFDLNQYLSYCEKTGNLYWKPRKNKGFNTKFAGKVANRLMPATKSQKQYQMVKVLGYEILAHRAIMMMRGCDLGALHIDHVNGDGTDNRLKNLRVVTRAENNKNRRRGSNNTSGVLGVTFISAIGKWRAQIKEGNKFFHLGYYSDWFDAVCARKAEEFKRGFHENHGSDRPLYGGCEK